MSWLEKLNPFKKKAEKKEASAPEEAVPGLPGMPQLPPELANNPAAKGMMGAFLRKWKDPAFLKQMRVLAAHMQKEGVDVKNFSAVKEWMEKNKERIESGALNEAPAKPGETYVKTEPEIGRNDPCHCGSGKKFKKCHGR